MKLEKHHYKVSLFFIIAVAIGMVIGIYVIPNINFFAPSYYAVYVGQLHMFPQMRLQNPYILQSIANQQGSPSNTTANTGNNFQLVPLSQSVWAPNVLYLNPKEVVLYGPVTKGSEIWNDIQPK